MEKKEPPKKCQPVFQPPKTHFSFLPFTTSENPTVGNPYGKSRNGQKMFRSACDPPASDTTVCLEPVYQARATS